METVRGHIGEKAEVGASATLAILDRVAALCEEVCLVFCEEVCVV